MNQSKIDDSHHQLPNSTNSIFLDSFLSLVTTSTSEVSNLIKKLDVSKECGHDNLSNY